MSSQGQLALGTRVDWVEILEAAYAPAPDDAQWARRIVSASRPLFGEGRQIGLMVVEHPSDCSKGDLRVSVGDEVARTIGRESVSAFATVGRHGVRELFYPPSMVTTQLEIGRRLAPGARDFMSSFRARHGVFDGLGLMMHPEPGVAAVLYAGYANEVVLSRHQRKVLARVALHVEAGGRLRQRPECVVAVLTPAGQVLDCRDEALTRQALGARVKAIESSRRLKSRRSPDALELWPALVAGRCSLVERSEGSRRLYYVVENALARQPLRALTRRELDVLSQAARGLTGKLVAYSLGISVDAVSAALSGAACKLGLATRLELVRLAAMLGRDPRARFDPLALTDAERDVVELLSSGLSNAQIATIRHRSVRTIANQVAALLRKSKSPTRRALAIRFHG